MSEVSSGAADPAADLALARAGDDAAFARLAGPLRRELHAHCYRMLGSAHDAEDALQEALLRAWRGIDRFEGRAGHHSLRAWLYTVATRTCLDAAERRGRRALPVDLGPASERVVLDSAPDTGTAWLGPYPTAGLAAGPADPAARYEQREAVELAFVAALQHLPGNQRAALLLFDVLGFSAAEIAALMDTTAASVQSALARARRQLARNAPARGRMPDDALVRETAAAYGAALERGDADALVALLTEDVTWSMPPLPHWYRGRSAVMAFAVAVPLTRCPSWRTTVVEANSRPAVACYVGPAADAGHTAWSITVLDLTTDGRIAALTSFLGAEQFAAFGLPTELP
ncbi:sigma-70 family RNA polymerase sigma factor [Streptomyces sp. TLI_171]|uniref:sigma-70 family RNA polymerase sigma factor n=1 Tax=Streptomyces sp. TLI_171 TaxID=1938859 RepID=UPI000C174AEC|nr:sigma-70 family RNA polymerase sigma factor [Streptomyces sp. TLI_171]RKE20086.1 RNA polymerase ECF family sigma subunit [Streptomyces sp. TLI_171]